MWSVNYYEWRATLSRARDARIKAVAMQKRRF